MTKEYISLIAESITQQLMEGWFSQTANPHMSKIEASRELGKNVLRTDVGNHASNDEVRQPSTFDRYGANFKGEHITLSDNMFTVYKIKNFGNDSVKDTLSFFGSGANGEKELRRAIDTINGGADRNGRDVRYRTITSVSNKRKSEMSSYMSNTFWEFSFNGEEWFILKPNPIQTMKQSKLNRK